MDVSIWELRPRGSCTGWPRPVIDPAGVLRLRPGDCHAADGERVGDQLLASSQPLPRAVFCQSDELAFGLIASLRRAGVQCPRDISVAGFDDHPMARLWDLTTLISTLTPRVYAPPRPCSTSSVWVGRGRRRSRRRPIGYGSS